MLTAIPTAPCIAPYGDYLLALSIQNKQDYARLNSYELHVMAQAVDPQHTQPGPWQKVAQIQQVQIACIPCGSCIFETYCCSLCHGA